LANDGTRLSTTRIRRRACCPN